MDADARRRAQRNRRTALATAGSPGEVAVAAIRRSEAEPAGGLLVVAAGERRAGALAGALAALAPEIGLIRLPAWDCLPYDRAAPARFVMGRRLAAIAALAAGPAAPWIAVASPAALLQRIPPADAIRRAMLRLRPGDAVAADALARALENLGYALDDRVDEPGEAALRGQVSDIFPAGAERPVRIEHDDGRITGLRSYDPVSQIADGDLAELVLLPASEHFVEAGQEPAPRFHGSEHWLPEFVPDLATLFDFLPGTPAILDPGAADRAKAFFAQVADAHESRTRLRPARADGRPALPPDRLYLDEAEWERHLAGRPVLALARAEDGERPPRFASEPRPLRRLAGFVRRTLAEGRRVVLAAPGPDLRTLRRAVEPEAGSAPVPATGWREIDRTRGGGLFALAAALDGGFVDRKTGTFVLTAADVLGSRARRPADAPDAATVLTGTELDLRVGDLVVHAEHGIGALRGLETVEAAGSSADFLRIEYARDAMLLVPTDEMNRVWRYGSGTDQVALDRIDSDAWDRRRQEIEAEVAATAARLAATIRARESAGAEALSWPQPAYERFVAGFPYPETADQARAIAATLADLSSGRAMNRLVCGDVGFGKTEVALRTAAAVALAGRQVAIVAPTTVLARQHADTFRRRFGVLGLEVAHLSRLVAPAEAKRAKAGLADGTIRVVVGTHALAAKGVRYADLGLVVIDEEQRFGAAQKARLRGLAAGAHVLTLTATPIPRTLQAALVGLQEISVIATPPARRQPIRTFLVPFDDATVREALLRERGRDGQSFVVCPRIEDIAPLARKIAGLVPELDTTVIHGRMSAVEIDDAMIRFAEGSGDVLLATSIIESGLDVPRANTMLVWRPDRFGLAQLHQLRGRVGRRRARGVAYLMTDPESPPAPATRKRLETLQSLDRLGAGFAISARDLDQRGAGDLFGEEQAGHVRLIGVPLYQHLLARALAGARGEAVAEEWSPEINLEGHGSIPAEYIPEVDLRISLHARLARLADEDEVDEFEEEIRNRFGAPPPPVERLIARARIWHQSRAYEVARVDAGPQAVALTFRESADRALIDRAVAASDGALEERQGRLVWTRSGATDEERLANAARLFRFLAKVERSEGA